MNIKGFIELHDYRTHVPRLIRVGAIESVSNKFIVYGQAGFNVDEDYDEILKLMDAAQVGEGAGG